MSEILLTKKEVATRLNISERHVQNLMKREGFPKPVRLGRLIRFRPQDVERFING
jgi:excisionase family DNA binding protein